MWPIALYMMWNLLDDVELKSNHNITPPGHNQSSHVFVFSLFSEIGKSKRSLCKSLNVLGRPIYI
jgi:hypothetical protein